MRKLLPLLLALCAPFASAAEIDVYLFGGQSNMQGLGITAELTPEQKAPPPGVYFRQQHDKAFTPLRPGVTPTAGRGVAEFGPEIAFAHEMARAGKKIYIVKAYRSGTALDSGWADQKWVGGTGPGRRNFYPGTGPKDPDKGTAYMAMIACYTRALKDIVADGDKPVVRAMMWVQGEQDSKNELSAKHYAANIARLTARVKEDLGLEKLPFLMTEILPYGSAPGEKAAARFHFRDEVRRSQAAADETSGKPGAVPGVRLVPTRGLSVRPDLVHYTTEAQLTLGRSLAQSFKKLQSPTRP